MLHGPAGPVPLLCLGAVTRAADDRVEFDLQCPHQLRWSRRPRRPELLAAGDWPGGPGTGSGGAAVGGGGPVRIQGIGAVGYTEADIPDLVAGTMK